MKSKHTLKAIAILAIMLSVTALVHGQRQPSHKPTPCHVNPRLCLAQMKSQLNLVQAYVSRVKPGDRVTFNPQPDPPGEPIFRRALQAYRSLQEEISDLSHFPPGPCKAGACHDAISNAQSKFGLLGQASDRNSANAALAEMKPCISQLSKVLK